MLLAPTVNLHRSPLAGRNFECFSEDPCLSARMAVAFVEGVQGEGVGCSVKHFVCNDSEFERNTISSEVDERTLRELYLNPVLPTKDGKSLGDASRRQGRRMTVRHMFAAPVVRLSDDGTEGWLVAYFTLVRSVDSEAGFERHQHEGTYTFSFVKQGDEWRISKMIVDTEIGHDRGFKPPAS